MKTLLIGDIHFGKYNNNEKFLEQQLAYLKTIQDLIIKEKIKLVIQLGDTFDNRFSTSNYVMTEITNNWFNWFNENKINMKCIMGNHDMYYKNESTHSPLFSFQSEFIQIVDKLSYSLDGKYMYVPFNHKLTENECNENLICLGHFDIINAKMNNNKNCDSGYSKDMFKKFKAVYSGHYHSPSEMDNIKYIGSIQQLDFNNFSEIHGVTILDDDKEIFIENTISPKFINVTYDTSNKITVDGLEEINLFNDTKSALEYIGNNYCKLIIRKVDNQIEFQNFKNSIEIREYVNLEILTEKFSTNQMSLSNIKDMNSLLKEFFNNLTLSDSLKLDNLMKLFFKYYHHVIDNKDMYSLLTDELKFNYVTFKNFLSYQNKETTINFTNGMNRLVGMNGTGKTSALIESINFLLFGGSLLGKKKPKLINNITNKKMLVKGEFSIADNTYKVIRGMKPEVFQIFKNNEEIKRTGSTDDYQKILNTFIGINSKQLQYLLLKNKKVYKPFSLLSTPEKREFIEKMFNLDVFSDILTLVKADLSQNKIDIDLTWKDIQKWEELIKQEENHILKLEEIEKQRIEKEIKVLNDNIKQINNNDNIKSLESNLSSQNHILNSIQEKNSIKLLDGDIIALNALNDGLRDNGKDYLIDLNKQIKDKRELYTNELNYTKLNDKIISLKKTLNEEEEKLSDYNKSYEEFKNDKTYSDDNIKIINDKIKSIKKEVEELNKEFNELDVKITTNKTKITEATSTIEKMSSICGDCIRVPEITKNYNIDNLKEEINGYKVKKEQVIDKIYSWEEDISFCNEDIQKIETKKIEIKFIENQIIELQNKSIPKLNDNIIELEEEIKYIINNDTDNKVKLMQEIDELESKKQNYIDDVGKKIQNNKNNIEEKEIKIKELEIEYEKDLNKKLNEISNIEVEIKEIKDRIELEIKSKEREVEILEESINNIEIKSDEIITLRNNLRLEQENYEEQNTDFKHLEFIKKMLMEDDSIKSFIINQYLDFINYEFNMNLAKFNVPFALMFDKNLNQEFMGDYSDLEYNNLSSGEEKSIDFSIMFTFDALQEKLFNRKINVVVFDEILSGLDTNKTRIAFEELKRMSEDKSVWIVEHLFEYDVDKTFIVTKDKITGSKMEEEK